jgi:hypothetical protein
MDLLQCVETAGADVNAVLCAAMGAAVFVTHSYKHLRWFQIFIYFLASACVGYLASEEVTAYFEFPYRNSVAFLAGASCLIVALYVHKLIRRRLS